MAKYNIREKKAKPAIYRNVIKAEIIDAITEQILHKMIVEKKYKDPGYTAGKMAEELQTNTRYISATLSLRFQQNYAELVNTYRIREAVSMLSNKRNIGMTIGEVAEACGYSNRQSFYASFYRIQGKTPRQFRDEFFAQAKVKAAQRKPRKNKKTSQS